MSIRHALPIALAGTLIAAVPSSAQLAIVVGAEFQVNSYTDGGQLRPAVASETNGDFVVVWNSPQDGAGLGVFGRRFTSAGAQVGAEFQVNVHVTGDQWAPDVAADGDGDFVVVWHSGASHDGSYYGVFARRYASSGAAIGGEFQVHSYTLGIQSYPSVAMGSGGRFVVVWQSYNIDGSFFSIQFQRFDVNGSPVSNELRANSTTLGNQILPAVAMNDEATFVAAWESSGQDGDGYGIFATSLTTNGTTLTGEKLINTFFTSLDQRNAAIGINPNGSFVVAWDSEGSVDGSDDAVLFRRFTSNGIDYGGGLVNQTTFGEQKDPSLALASPGVPIIAWTEEDDGNDTGIFARRFTSGGSTLGPDLQINAFTTGTQASSAIAASGSGFVVVWESPRDGSATGIFARRGLVSSTFDVDGDGQLLPLTDGLLFLRAFFGFSGTTLTSGAVGGNCTRCTPAAIASYIASIIGLLDIDNDETGAVEPLTDGLLIVRYLFGFRGPTLVDGAVRADCNRCTSAGIEAHFLAND